MNRNTEQNRQAAQRLLNQQTVMRGIVAQEKLDGVYLYVDLPEGLTGMLLRFDITAPDLNDADGEDNTTRQAALDALAPGSQVRVTARSIVDVEGSESEFVILLRLF